ncbi:MAG: ATP-dependent metalloprotease, partial [Methylophaga sp.]|nr:ATP-dependent metalloprotease [Methylophaga sp.]
QHKAVSDLTAKQIDEDVRALITRNYDRAKNILTENMDKLHTMAKLLIKYETIDSDQIDAIMNGREPGEPKGWDDKSSTPPTAASGESDAEPSGKPADQLN